MSKAEEFIDDCTRNCSQLHYNSACTLRHCITPDQARMAVDIAREETIKEVCEWLYNHNDYICGSTNGITMYDMDKLIENLKKYLTKENERRII